jgi:formate dehydrogenase subunit gamma
MIRSHLGRCFLLGLSALLAGLTAFASTASAQSVNPTANSVKEQQLLEALKPSSPSIEGRGSIPDNKSQTVIQPGGPEWRQWHQETLPKVALYSIAGISGLLVVFYLIRGKVRITGGRSGQTLVRFKAWDRFTHWMTASSFIVLGLSGLNISFGKVILLPLIGPSAFTTVSQYAKFSHNYVSFAFMLGITMMFLLWAWDNIPSFRDLIWFALGGGLIGLGHPAAGRFNGGQKVIFWSVVLGGAALSLSGLVLMFPFQGGTVIGDMQLANTVHALVGVVLVAIIIAHVYIGSVGMEGAFEAMGSGKVDLNWAREHHSIWAAKALAESTKGKAPSVAPAE